MEPPDSFYLSAAVGWLGLGNWREAMVELEKIAPAFRAHPDVLEVQFDVCSKAGQWDAAAETARALVQILPKKAQFWIFHAYATRRMTGGDILQAREILSRARTLFPKEYMIAYNLACYECQLGHHDEARKWLKAASDLGDPRLVKLMASADPDLKPLEK